MSRPVESLIGREFDRLTVEAEALRRSGKPAWLCRCTCGNTKVVLGQSLRQLKTVSCGCYRQELRRKVRRRLNEKEYGRLTVLRMAGNVGGYTMWLCRCACGCTVKVRSTNLTSGHTTSCGCYRKEQARLACTTHGLSHTAWYSAFKARERLERKAKLDAFWTVEMEMVLRALQLACVLCGSTDDLSVDHVRALSLGYGLRPGNAVVLCGSCNSSKHNKSLSDLDEAVRRILIAAADEFYSHWHSAAEPSIEEAARN